LLILISLIFETNISVLLWLVCIFSYSGELMSLKLKTKKQIFSEIGLFLRLDSPKKIAIVADNDEDGITATVNLFLFLKNEGHTVLPLFFDRHLVKEEFSSMMKEFLPEKTIFLDLGSDFVEEALEDISKYTGEFVSIDHHKGEINYKNAKHSYLFIHPSQFSKIDSSKYPVSKMVYDIFGGKNWVAATGVVGDSSADCWKKFLISVQKEYSISYKEIDEVTQTIVAVRTQDRGKRDELFEYFCKIDDPKQIFKSDFYKLKKNFDKKIESIKKDYEKNVEKFNKSNFEVYFSKEGIVNPIINPLAKEYPSKTFMVYKEIAGMCNASFRRGDYKINLPDMISFSLKGIPNSAGGGHVPAAGASFPKKHFSVFMERVISYLSKKNA